MRILVCESVCFHIGSNINIYCGHTMRNEKRWVGESGGYLTLYSQNSVDLHVLMANEIGPRLKVGLCETGCFVAA
jgi:hypothetical protein